MLSAAALGAGAPVPSFAQVMRPQEGKSFTLLSLAIGILLIGLALLTVPAALALVFDPRYRDFPFPALTGAAVPLLFLATWSSRPKAAIAERAMAATVGISAVWILCNEGFGNWQACWFCLGLIILGLILVREPFAPG
jgi:glucan 1,3-beta-glucosidase